MEIRIKTAEEFRDSHVTIQIVADNATEAGDVAQSIVRACEGPGCPNMADVREESVRSDHELRERIAHLEKMLQESGRLYTADEVGHFQYTEAELIGQALRADLERERKVTRDLERHYQRKLAEADERADRLIARANELETELAEINQRAKTFRDQAYKQNDRAAELRQQIKELGDRHQRELENARTAHNATRNRVETVTRHREVAEREVARLKRQIEQARELLTADEVAQARRAVLSDNAMRVAHAIGAALQVLDQA